MLNTDHIPDNTWVIVPAYNEQEVIGQVLDDLQQLPVNVVVVDDDSKDTTVAEVLRRPVWLLRHSVNLGQGAALQTGIDFALLHGADYVVTFDADGQHAAADVPSLIDAMLKASADFALGSRFLGKAQGIPLLRKLTLRAGIVFTRFFSGISLTDVHNGIRAMTRTGAMSLGLTLNRMEHASEIIHQIQ